eukprot:scaffold29367_cov53-Attheya_sp.AAC.2
MIAGIQREHTSSSTAETASLTLKMLPTKSQLLTSALLLKSIDMASSFSLIPTHGTHRCRLSFHYSPGYVPRYFGCAGTIWAPANRFRSSPRIHLTNGNRGKVIDLARSSLLNRWFGGVPSNRAATGGLDDVERTNQKESSDENDGEKHIRIGIVGGGIAGVTAAASIAKHASSITNKNCPKVQITVFESYANFSTKNQINKPLWVAAAARNANTIVPGASMHPMATRDTLIALTGDMVRDFFMAAYQRFSDSTSNAWIHKYVGTDPLPRLSLNNFNVTPPYFAVDLGACYWNNGVTSNERKSFVNFCKQMVWTCLMTGDRQAKERAAYMVQLSKANRAILLQEFQSMNNIQELGIQKGFLALYRTKEKAEHAVQECRQFGESADIIPWSKAVEMEPALANMPMQGDRSVFVVYRPDDMSANCLLYVQKLADRCRTKLGIRFKEGPAGTVTNLKRLPLSGDGRFEITCADGSTSQVDYMVLAAGTYTPLLAQQVGAGNICPTFPLRGFSLTVHVDEVPKQQRTDKGIQPKNLLQHPLSLDSMYVSSVGPTTARVAGFGELVGYRHNGAGNVGSVAPKILSRYVQMLVPGAVNNAGSDGALQCFRPLSPDDLPLVGSVKTVPGLFFHHGHGTYGWTMCLATAECLAQSFFDELSGNAQEESVFELPNNSKIARSILSPDRFS